MINDILRATRSFPVATWDDTDESRSAAYIIRRQLNALLKKYPEARRSNSLRELTAFSDLSQPTSFVIDYPIDRIEWIKYKTSDKYREVHYMDPQVFMQRADMMNPNDSYVQQIVINSVEVNIFNDRTPKYWTTFDNSVILMDGYDSEVDDTLQSSKSQVYVRESVDFEFNNTFVIPIDESMIQVLLEEAISSAYVEFKGSVNPKAEAQARRGRIIEQRKQNQPKWTAYGRP